MALFGLHTPTFGPLHPIIGKLDGSTGLSGFTNTYVPFGNAAGGLDDSANLTWNGSKLWVYGGGIALETTGSIVANAADLYLKDNASFLWFGDTAGHNPYWYIGHNTGNLNLFSNSTDADYINFGKTTTYSTYTVDSGNFSLVGDLLVNGGDIGITADTDLLQLASGALTINGNATATGTVQAEHLYSTDDLVVDGLATIGETLGVTGIATIGDGSQLATSAAPTTDPMIVNKKYADDQDALHLLLDCSNDPLTNTLDGANFDFTGTGNVDSTMTIGGITYAEDKIEYTDSTEYIDQEEW